MKRKTPQCSETVYVADTYRYTGRGSSGFQMAYSKQQCSRAGKYNGLCAVHSPFPMPGLYRRRGQSGMWTTHDGRFRVVRDWPGTPWSIYEIATRETLTIHGASEYATLYDACLALAALPPQPEPSE